MKTYSILILILIQGWISTQAQVPAFDLAKYARPNLTRKSLDLSLGFNSLQHIGLSSQINEKNKNSSIGGRTDFSYQSFKNSPKIQENTYVYLSLIPQRSTGSVEDIWNQKDNSFVGNLSISSTRLRYSEKGTFIGWNLNLNYYSFSHKNTRDRMLPTNQSISDFRESSQIGRLDLPFVVGKGRIERVEDARHGLFILQELQRNQYLARELTEEDILGFAAKVSELKNRRYFDFRLQKIWELEQIHAYLLEEGIVDTENIAYFAIVQDIWSFGNQPHRQAGNRFSIGIDPNLRITHQTSKKNDRSTFPILDSVNIDNSIQSNFAEPALYLAFIHEKPLSEAWQETFIARAELGLLRESYTHTRIENNTTTTLTSKGWGDFPSLQASAVYSLGFYPNTRSFYQANLSSRFSQYREVGYINSSPSLPFEWTNANVALGFNAYYYLSPQTRLTFNYNLQVYSGSRIQPFLRGGGFWEEFKSQGQFHQSGSVSLDFAWF